MQHKCAKCGVPETPETFYPRYSGKTYPYCKVCTKSRNAKWSKDNKEKRGAIEHKSYVRRTYGISYEAMLVEQSGGCAICGLPDDRTRLCVDHNHETGKVRGLLCNKCNRAVGLLNDSAGIAKALAEYLERHEPCS